MTGDQQQQRSFSTRFFIIFCIFFLLTAGLRNNAVAQVHSSVAPSHLRKSCSIDRDGAVVDFTVTGRMPEQARMSVTSVEREDEEGNPMLAAYDITLTDGRGQEWQPAYGQPAQVTITDPIPRCASLRHAFCAGEVPRHHLQQSVHPPAYLPAKHHLHPSQNGLLRLVAEQKSHRRRY